MKTVPLGGKKAAGRVAFIDDGDCELVSRYRWNVWEYKGRGPYARTTDSRNRVILMHKLITGYARTDHANGNGLDNRRSNLRRATGQENSRNTRARSGASSHFKGVSYVKARNQWAAYIIVRMNPRQRIFLGYFDIEEEAARAYDMAAVEHFGEFAWLNFPGDHGLVVPRREPRPRGRPCRIQPAA